MNDASNRASNPVADPFSKPLRLEDLDLHGYTLEQRLHGIALIQDPVRADIVRYAAQEIARLKRELATMQTAGIIEVAVRNPSVAEYMRHWEGRALAAEARTSDETRDEPPDVHTPMWHMTAAHRAACPTCNPQYPESERILRRLLALTRPGLYGDDGELQDSASGVDFVRDTAQEIDRKLAAWGLEQLRRAQTTGAKE